jgi:hypothetical protein
MEISREIYNWLLAGNILSAVDVYPTQSEERIVVSEKITSLFENGAKFINLIKRLNFKMVRFIFMNFHYFYL